MVSTRGRDTNAHWWGYAGYVAYDWTDQLRTAVRGEYFKDADGARTLAAGAGTPVSLWEITATVQYKIWKGLVGRVEYRHDQADRKVFKIRAPAWWRPRSRRTRSRCPCTTCSSERKATGRPAERQRGRARRPCRGGRGPAGSVGATRSRAR